MTASTANATKVSLTLQNNRGQTPVFARFSRNLATLSDLLNPESWLLAAQKQINHTAYPTLSAGKVRAQYITPAGGVNESSALR